MDELKENKKQVSVSFLAVDQYIVDNIVKPIEKEFKDKGFIYWGEYNDYPDYIENLYKNVATLKSIIDGLTDYICGDDIEIKNEIFSSFINSKGETLQDIIRYIAKDLGIYNGFALNIVKNKLGGIAEIYYLDFKKVRSNKEGTKFYYAKDWGKSAGRVKYVEYDSFFTEEGKKQPNTIFYYKNETNAVYPYPIYGAAVIACEIEKLINEYHINLVNNGFSANYIVNFNNGIPTDQQKEEIEYNFYEKFTGVENCGRPMLVFNNTKDNEATVTKVDTDNFADKYNSLADRSREQIFTAFRCSPILFGIDQQKTGFNANEYASAFKLFNKTIVEPYQKIIKKSFDKIFDTNDLVEFTPFTINFEKDGDIK